jgi:hypothetical protein
MPPAGAPAAAGLFWKSCFWQVVGTALSQLVNKLATHLLRRYLVDKFLEQHCHNLLTSLLQACLGDILLTSCWEQHCRKSLMGFTGSAGECCFSEKSHWKNLCPFLAEYTRKTHKLLQVCKQVVTNLFTNCWQAVFALLVPSCCNKFGTSS